MPPRTITVPDQKNIWMFRGVPVGDVSHMPIIEIPGAMVEEASVLIRRRYILYLRIDIINRIGREPGVTQKYFR